MDDAQMAPNEIRDATAFGIACVLGLAERPIAPAVAKASLDLPFLLELLILRPFPTAMAVLSEPALPPFPVGFPSG